MAPFIRSPGAAGDPGIIVSTAAEQALRTLEARNDALDAEGAYDEEDPSEAGPPGGENDEHCTREDYASVLAALRPAFCHAAKNSSLMLAWMVMVPASFVSAVRRRKPLALAVVAHYGVALHLVRDNEFVNDLGKRVVDAVNAELGEEWDGIMAWPKAEVGLSSA